MRIASIVLNWNRAALLRQTLESYLATVAGPFELIIVDNASSDNSREVIEGFRSEFRSLKTIFLNENLGGEAINLALKGITGHLIHISENDQLFLDGLSQHVRDCFAAFAGLGQLSLHGVVPTDDEAWELKPTHLRFSKGKIVYEAHGNIGTSSLIPAHVFRAGGVRLHNIACNGTGSFKLPDDARLSADIKNLNLWCAWSDSYYVRNIGHEVNEFGRDPDYYRQNYQSKPWVGIDGFQRRLDAARSRPRASRRSVVFPGATLQPEKTPDKIAGQSSQLGSMFDGYAAEAEVIDFLYALVRMIKPEHALETGTWLGRSAIAIGSALRDNGFGYLTSLEADPEVARCAIAEIETADLHHWVKVVTNQSLNFQPEKELQFALFDSPIDIRAKEFRHFYGKLAAGASVVFPDTGAQHRGLADTITELITHGQLSGSFFPTPRGVFVGTVQRPPVLPARAPVESKANFDHTASESSSYQRAAILVLGVHRSGTSCLAQLLNALGAKLPAQLAGPSHGNPFGHWEPARLLEINEEILAAIGRTWDDPRPIPAGWFRSPAAYAFHERLRALITSEYGNAPLILIKEPRICRLAPLYLDVLDVLGIKPLVVLPVRQPSEVIRSIQERDHIDPWAIELLWLRNLLEAEAATRACVRVWTSFDRLLDEGEITAQSIAAGLGIVWPNEQENVVADVSSILRPRYRHYRFADDRAPVLLSDLTTRAWQAARHGLSDDEIAAQSLFDEIGAALAEFDRFSAPQLESVERQFASVKTKADEFREREAQILQLQTELSQRVKESEQLRQQLDSMQASVCWRLTWPIRRLHQVAIHVGRALFSSEAN
jgi:hypothetical protein